MAKHLVPEYKPLFQNPNSHGSKEYLRIKTILAIPSLIIDKLCKLNIRHTVKGAIWDQSIFLGTWGEAHNFAPFDKQCNFT